MKEAKVITFGIYKGGSGKTSNALNVSFGLAKAGNKVLMIDQDPQGNLTTSTGKNFSGVRTLYDAMIEGRNLPFYNVADNVFITPADPRLLNIDNELARTTGRNSRLAALINPVKKSFDYIVVDCPPNNGIASNGGLMAGDYLLIPAEAAVFSLRGIAMMYEAVECAIASNSHIRILGIVITRYKKSNDKDFSVAEIRGTYGHDVLNTIIRETVSISAAQLARRSVFDFAPKSIGATDYGALVDEIIEKLKILNNEK